MNDLHHPAAMAAGDLLSGWSVTPAAVLDRGEVVAVLLDGDEARFVVFMRQDPESGKWITPRAITGSQRRSARPATTSARTPLDGVSHKLVHLDEGPQGWFAVTGNAAPDAVSVTLATDIEESTEPVLDGVAFVVARAGRDTRPKVSVRTADGQIYAMSRSPFTIPDM